MQESHLSLALYRSKRDATSRRKRDFVYYSPINITEHITPELLQSIVDSLMLPRRHNGKHDATHFQHIYIFSDFPIFIFR